MTARTKLKPRVQADEFSLALKDWLSGKISGHLGPYMYTDDQDDHRWKEGHSADGYYLGRDDKATFDLMLADLNVEAETFFDLGPGGEDSILSKSIPIVQSTGAGSYIAMDLSPTLAHTASTLVSDELDIRGTPLIANFFEEFPVTKANAFIALMGGTLGNLETHANASSLKKRLMEIFSYYRRAITKSGYFLVSFDANANAQEILGCYENPELAELVRSSVDRAIDISDFEYQVTWSPENHQLALGLRSLRDQMVRFDNEQFPIEQGEFLSVLNSYRFPVEFVVSAAAAAGWSHTRTWSATGRVHYLLFKAD